VLVLVTGTGANPPKERNPRFGVNVSFSSSLKVPRFKAIEKTGMQVEVRSANSLGRRWGLTWWIETTLCDGLERERVVRSRRWFFISTGVRSREDRSESGVRQTHEPTTNTCGEAYYEFISVVAIKNSTYHHRAKQYELLRQFPDQER
jgi:hypothetical protein